jgi:hypothetical protein
MNNPRPLPGYRAFRNAAEVARHANIYGDRPAEILHRYYPFKDRPTFKVRNPDGYPIGTQLPLTIGGNEYLFMFAWHKNDKSDPRTVTHPELLLPHPGITVFVPDERVVHMLTGRWLVTFDTGWSWYYLFFPNRAVSYTDIKDPPEEPGHGRWCFSGRSIKIQWQNASEDWWLGKASQELDPRGQRGDSRVGQGALSATKVYQAAFGSQGV